MERNRQRERGRQPGDPQDPRRRKAEGGPVGNPMRSQADRHPASGAQLADAGPRNAVGGQRPPLDGELSPHEVPSKAKGTEGRG